MLELVVVPVVLQLLLPVALLARTASRRPRTTVAWTLEAVIAGLLLGAIALAGLWLVVPRILRTLWIALLPLALVRSWRARTSMMCPIGWRARFGLAWRVAALAGAVFIAIRVVASGRLPDGPVVDLDFPLRGKGYVIANGGSDALLNAHVTTLSDARFASYRGQSWGVDIVKLNRWGFRARGLLPHSPDAYVIYGEPVHAPCDGAVVDAVDGIADLPPPTADREHLAGNHVLLDCDGVHVVLAHLRRGSTRVRRGDHVKTGTVLGEVGNSGNTSEPHLHIHAQRHGWPVASLSGEPLPIRLDGRYLARNARIDR